MGNLKNDAQRELDEFISSGGKIGVWVDEQIPIENDILEYNPESQTFSVTRSTKYVTQKTQYVHSVPKKIRCADGEHIFKCLDPHKYIFGCQKCGYKRLAFPTTYKLKDGKLINRINGKPL